MFIGSAIRLGPNTPLAAFVAGVFAGGQNGAWFEPNSAISTPWYQDSAATTPITAAEQPIGNARDKSGNTNHALQATAAARPVLSSRVNLLTKTEDFAGSAWLTSGVTVTPNNVIAPDGTVTGARLVFGVAEPDRLTYPGVIAAPGAHAGEIWLRSDSGTPTMSLRLFDGVSEFAYSSVVLSTTWQPFSIAGTAAAAFAGPDGYQIRNPLGGGTGATVYAWHPQFNTGPTATRYQRVNTATDYDTAGFSSYEKFDGIDDSLSSATGGGGASGFFFCAAVKVTGGAGSPRIIFGDGGSSTGYHAGISSANLLRMFAGNGAAYITLDSVATVDVGTISLITVWDDGTNLNVQIGSGTISSVARPVVAAGLAAITLGKDGNVGGGAFFPGNIYAAVYAKNSGLTALQRQQIQAYCRQQAGI